MQLPKLISFAEPEAFTFYTDNKAVAKLPGIHLSASSGCVAKCTTAANRCSYCAPGDSGCWDDCAGVGVGNCVAQCP